jgi:hypothetical protein
MEAHFNEQHSLAGYNAYDTVDGKQGCNVGVGEDNGCGAWRSHMKLFTHSSAYRRVYQKEATQHTRRPDECGYRTLNSAHIDCKKDLPSIVQNTVAGDSTKGYETLMASQLVFVGNDEQGTFQGFLLPK